MGRVTRPLPGRLELLGLRCDGRHGSSPEARARTSTFLVDLRVLTDLAPIADADDLETAVDLSALAATVRAVIGGPSRFLLETLVVDVARAVLQRFATLEEVHVRISLPQPPGLDAAEEAVDLTLSRTDSTS
jgi:7,8-dihydroneopterin aldolase/epimerase/oxygenase